MDHATTTTRVVLYEDGADDDALALSTLSLKRELEDLGMGQISHVKIRNTIPGTKGELMALGMLALTILPALIPSVAEFLQQWVIEGRRVVLEAPNGAKIEFVPGKKLTDSELMDWLEQLNAISSQDKN